MKNKHKLKRISEYSQPTRSQIDQFLLEVPEGEYFTENVLEFYCGIITYSTMPPYNNPYPYGSIEYYDYALNYMHEFNLQYTQNWNTYNFDKHVQMIYISHPIGADGNPATIVYNSSMNQIIYASENAF